ncbi:uncharacterized protein F5147DRAFT_773630 [Suillus discolor]|uniref:RBR-type E3 ubiquitin transferase n=1 Tax=Suillus discolor TaxID=1912936 RepID=A0A9P7JU71_9AGAM|nr:uncharacterized protein F5147DRAFT_773630 [Suillus discolor]KAG2108426.1 hypothetical protein F5147DRAFT_773630 [Suillus discolor]
MSQRPASENSAHTSVGPSRSSKGGEVCRAWKAGMCARGTKCRFLHGIEEHLEDVVPQQIETEEKLAMEARAAEIARAHAAETARVRAAETEARAAETARVRAAEAKARAAEIARVRAAEAKARAAEIARVRAAEAKARAAEIARVRAAEAKARAAEIARVRAAEAKARAAEIAKVRAAEAKARAAEIAKVRAAEAKARAAEIAKEAAAKTVQNVVLGSIVTFSAGLELSHLITGFECCTLRIANLPPNVREDEINALFTNRGLDRGRFHLVSVKPMPGGGKLSAEIITDAESGKALSLDLGGLEFRDEVLTLEVSGYNSPGSMSAATERDSNVLTISWRAPSVRYVAEYPDTVNAIAKVQELNRQMCSGRRVKVEINTMPPGRFISTFHNNSIKISFLPPTISDEEVKTFSGSDGVRRLTVKGGGVFSEDVGHITATLREDIECISPGTLKSLEPLLPTPSIDGTVMVRARFSSWEDADAVHTRLINHRIGNVSFWFRLPNPTQYSITISTEQFRAQKPLWDALIGSIKDKRACMLHIHEQSAVVRMRLSGSKKEAIGALKVRAESLIAGEKVEGWHMTLGYPNNKFLRSVFDDTGALVRADCRRQVLKVYGESKAVEQARELIKDKLEQLSSLEYTKVLAKQSVRFFIARGIPELRETFGEDNVKFVISARRITISGGEEARHALERLIQGSLSGPQTVPDPSGQQSCPICYDNVSSPLPLGCGHVYCSPCMRHFLTSALESGQFPLTCMGDETQCKVPIPIPTIQQFLPQTSFNRLLEIAFHAYISRHPQEFKYCKTPDCNQIYRSTDPSTAVAGQCPSCFSNICTSCHDDGHDGMDCAENKRQAGRVAEERETEAWLAAHGGRVKKCPTCQALIEKVDGCNHMTCTLCDSHICWRCMGVFSRSTIYEHMNRDHGTIYDENPVNEVVNEAVNVQEQQWLFGLAAQQRQQQEELRDWRAEQARFEERQRREAEAAIREEAERRAAIARREAIRGEQARLEAVRREQARLEDARRDEARRRITWQDHEAQYQQMRQRERARAQAQQEERPGWGCAIM